MTKYLEMLTQTALFAGITETEIEKMLTCLSVQKKFFQKDTCIFHMGETTELMGLVLSGSVLSIQEDLWGRRNIMTKTTVGDVFAEPFASTQILPMNINVVANEDCEILLLDVNRILTLCPSTCSYHTKLIKNLVSVLAKKVLSFNDKITHMSKKTTKEKLLSFLSSESIRQQKLEFDIPYDRQQLADFLCVERAAMSVELSKLQKQGILSFNKNHFILNQEHIEKFDV